MTPEEIARVILESYFSTHHNFWPSSLCADIVEAIRTERARAEKSEAALAASEAREKVLAEALRDVDSYCSLPWGHPMRTIKLWKRFRTALAAYEAAHPTSDKEEASA